MKTTLTFTILSTLLSLPAYSSSLKTVVTPFWQAPQITEVNLKIEAQHKDLVEECNRFRKLMIDGDGNPFTHTADRFSRFRSNPRINGPWDAKFFETSFVVTNANALFSENEIFYREQDKKLPYFYQEKAFTDIHLESVEKVDFIVKPGRTSYSQMAREAGVADSEVTIITGLHHDPVLKIAGKDMACDLLEGNIALKVSAPATVLIPEENKKKLGDFYFRRITSSVNKVMAKKFKSAVKFGARMGGFFGEDLREELGLNFDQRVDYIDELVDFLFKPNSMEPTAVLGKFDTRYEVKYVTSADAAPVTVNFSL
jgi:hypothetical protein